MTWQEFLIILKTCHQIQSSSFFTKEMCACTQSPESRDLMVTALVSIFSSSHFHLTNLFTVVSLSSSTRSFGATTWFFSGLSGYVFILKYLIVFVWLRKGATSEQETGCWSPSADGGTGRIANDRFGVFLPIPSPFNLLQSQNCSLWRKMTVQCLLGWNPNPLPGNNLAYPSGSQMASGDSFKLLCVFSKIQSTYSTTLV